MIRFPVADTALEGFRLTREQPRAVLIWALLLLVGNAAIAALVIASGQGPTLVAAGKMHLPDDAERLSAMMVQLAPVMLLAGLVNLLINTVIYTAVMRAVLDPGRTRVGYLRLGLEEARVFGVVLVLVLLLAFYFILASTLVALLRLSLGEGATFLGAAAATAATVAGVYALLRLSLAPAMTLADGRFSLVRAWPLTAGQFWGLLGMIVLAITLSAVVFVLAQIVFTALALVIGQALGQGGSLATMQTPDLGSFQSYFGGASSAWLIFNALLTALLFAILLAPLPAAFRALSGRVGAAEPSRA